MALTMNFPPANHDHSGCIAAILADAEAVCAERKVRLTPQRRRVLELVAESHNAIGAYEILERIAADGKRPAPITIYRALDFLIDQGLVHRLSSLNAYVACPNAAAAHGAQFLICESCGAIGEIADAGVNSAIDAAATDVGFAVAAPVVEIVGVCSNCRHVPLEENGVEPKG